MTYLIYELFSFSSVWTLNINFYWSEMIDVTFSEWINALNSANKE